VIVARRDAILAHAKPVFGSLGYHGATTREIAAAAGVSEALLYQHFPGKRELFEAVITRAAAELERRLTAHDERPDPLTAGIVAYFDFVEEESELYRVFFHQALHADPAFGRLYLELSRRFQQLVEDSVSALPESPPGARYDVVAHAVAGMVGELALWWVDERRHDKREMTDRAARMARAIYVSEVTNGTEAAR